VAFCRSELKKSSGVFRDHGKLPFKAKIYI
jgi:hypothetical protein